MSALAYSLLTMRQGVKLDGMAQRQDAFKIAEQFRRLDQRVRRLENQGNEKRDCEQTPG